MDRKGVTGLILVVALFGAWNFFYIRKSQEAAVAKRQYEETVAAEEAAKPKPAVVPADAASAPAVAGAPSVTPPPALETAIAEKLETVSSGSVDYAFTSLGGGIKRATLLEHFAVNEKKVVLNQYGTIAIGDVSEIAGEGLGKPFVSKVDAAAGTVQFDRTDERQIQLTKKFTLPKFEGLKGKDRLREEYWLTLDVSFTNRATQPVEIPRYFVHTGSSAPIHQGDLPTYTGFGYFKETSMKLVPASWFKGGGFLFMKSSPRAAYPEKPEVLSDVKWAGVTNQYFATLCTPVVDEKAMSDEQVKQRGIAVWARPFLVSDEAWLAAGHPAEDHGERDGVDGAIGMAGFKLPPGETATRTFKIYGGPREQRRLAELGNYEAEIMDFGMFGIVSRTLLASMNYLKGAIGSYAIAIILLTLVIKTAMWPLQNKATASMKRMQALQPEMTKMRDKYKDDPQAMNVETMKLYKQHGVNPFGGCLPMLVQIPIFFGFYNMLGKAVELRNSKFLWVNDLSQPDTIFHLLGYPVNVLPLCMAVTMLWSMALQPKSGDQMQQRIMMFVPLIFISFCYNFASALALYWTVQNIFSIVQLYVTRNKTVLAPEIVPAQKPKR